VPGSSRQQQQQQRYRQSLVFYSRVADTVSIAAQAGALCGKCEPAAAALAGVIMTLGELHITFDALVGDVS
jgi:hypothetical protein